MNNAEFFQQAQAICKSSFTAFFAENDYAKSMLHMDTACCQAFYAHGGYHRPADYKSYLQNVMPSPDFQSQAHIHDLHTTLLYKSADLCIVLITAQLQYPLAAAYTARFDTRTSYTVRRAADGQPQIVHLHFSVPKKTARNATLRYRPLASDAAVLPEARSSSPALAAVFHSPNAIFRYELRTQSISYANAAFYSLLGYSDAKNLPAHMTLSQLMSVADWRRLQDKLAQTPSGSSFTLNAALLPADRTPVHVLLRGRNVPADRPYCVLSAVPLELPVQAQAPAVADSPELNAGYSIPSELFLKLALDNYFIHGRQPFQNGQHDQMLELAATVLNASHALIIDVRSAELPLKHVLAYTAPAFEDFRLQPLTSGELLSICQTYTACCFDAANSVPQALQKYCGGKSFAAVMYDIIPQQGRDSFILLFLRQNNSAPWTPNEQKILHYTAKIFSFVLADYPHNENKKPCSAKETGAQA